MGLIYGSGSFTRFWVKDSPPADYLEEFQKGIYRHAFRKLDEASNEERSAGWVNIMDMIDNQFEKREFYKKPYIAMSWRVDVRKVPSKVLTQYCREAENEIKKEEELQYLPKGRRQEIKQMVHLQLLKRVLPRSNTYDMIWNTDTGIVLFGAVNTQICDEFAEFFLRTFDLHLTSIFPYSLAYRDLERKGMDLDIIEGLRSSSLVEDNR